MVIKGVVFDIGGVVVGSPIVGIHKYEKEHGLPFNYLNVTITARGRNSAFQKLERSELDVYSFYKQFGDELSDAKQMNIWYTEFCRARGKEVPPLPKEVKVDGRELFGRMMKESTTPDRKVLAAIRKLKKSGKFKIAALTNNIAAPTTTDPNPAPGSKARSLDEELEHLGMGSKSKKLKHEFDEFIESAVVGMRKPDPKFFQYMLDKLQLKGDEMVFLDDIGLNLKAAATLGIHTIRVEPASSVPALRKLEEYTGMQLIDENATAKL